jgi:hypothetical protein
MRNQPTNIFQGIDFLLENMILMIMDPKLENLCILEWRASLLDLITYFYVCSIFYWPLSLFTKTGRELEQLFEESKVNSTKIVFVIILSTILIIRLDLLMAFMIVMMISPSLIMIGVSNDFRFKLFMFCMCNFQLTVLIIALGFTSKIIIFLIFLMINVRFCYHIWTIDDIAITPFDDTIINRIEVQVGLFNNLGVIWDSSPDDSDFYTSGASSFLMVYFMCDMFLIDIIQSISIMHYIIHHECYNYSTLSSTFGRKEDSLFIIANIILFRMIFKQEYIIGGIQTCIFLYNTGKSGNGRTHMAFVLMNLLFRLGSTSAFHKPTAVLLLFTYFSIRTEYKLSNFREVYKLQFGNSHKVNELNHIRYYSNLPLYHDLTVKTFAELSLIFELLIFLK